MSGVSRYARRRPRITRRAELREPEPLRYRWTPAPNGCAAADTDTGDSLFVQRAEPWVRSFIGRINGEVVVRDQGSIRLAEVATERAYAARSAST